MNLTFYMLSMLCIVSMPCIVLSYNGPNFSRGISKSAIKNWFINRAIKKGIPWDQIVNKRKEEFKKLEIIKNDIENINIEYPNYYTKPFHGYDYGNLNWECAQEGEPATLSISSDYWEDVDPYTSASWVRNNITERLENYITFRESYLFRDILDYNSNILDLGCSVGISTEYLKNKYQWSNVEGMDLSPYFLSIARSRSMEKDIDIRYIHANGEDIPRKENYYDLVTCNFLFHELPSDASRRILDELHRVIKPYGVLMIADLDPFLLKEKLKNPFRKWAFDSTEPHISEYYETDMKELLLRSGFTNIEKQKNDPLNSVWLASNSKPNL